MRTPPDPETRMAMNLLADLRPTARRYAIAALSSAVLFGSVATVGTAPVAGSPDAGATQLADKKVKSKVSGRKIT